MESLEACKDCLSPVSIRAKLCPICGAPVWRDRAAHRVDKYYDAILSRVSSILGRKSIQFLIVAATSVLTISLLPFKTEGLSIGEHRNEIGAPLDSPLLYAMRFYSVIGRGFPPRFDQNSAEFSSLFEPIQFPVILDAYTNTVEARGHVYTGTYDVHAQLLWPAKSPDHLIAMMPKAKELHDKHVTFLQLKNARNYVFLVSIIEGLLLTIVVFLLLKILLYRREDNS